MPRPSPGATAEMSLGKRIALELGVAEPSVFQMMAIEAMFAAEVREFVGSHEVDGLATKLLGMARSIARIVYDDERLCDSLNEDDQEEIDRWLNR